MSVFFIYVFVNIIFIFRFWGMILGVKNKIFYVSLKLIMLGLKEEREVEEWRFFFFGYKIKFKLELNRLKYKLRLFFFLVCLCIIKMIFKLFWEIVVD